MAVVRDTVIEEMVSGSVAALVFPSAVCRAFKEATFFAVLYLNPL